MNDIPMPKVRSYATKTNTSSNSTRMIIGVIAVVGIIAIIAFFVFFNKNTTTNTNANMSATTTTQSSQTVTSESPSTTKSVTQTSTTSPTNTTTTVIAPTINPDQFKGWKAFPFNTTGFNIRFPKGWGFQNNGSTTNIYPIPADYPAGQTISPTDLAANSMQLTPSTSGASATCSASDCDVISGKVTIVGKEIDYTYCYKKSNKIYYDCNKFPALQQGPKATNQKDVNIRFKSPNKADIEQMIAILSSIDYIQ